MGFRGFLVLIVSQLFIGKIGAASDPSSEEDSVDLKQKMADMEKRLSSLEIRGQEEILKSVSEAETRCANSTEVLFRRLQDVEKTFIMVDEHLQGEIQRAHSKLSEALERIRNLEQASVLQQTITDKVKMNETQEMFNSFVASQHDTENVITESISSSTEKLRHLNDSLSSRFEGLELKMRILQKTLLEIEKDYANISFVSKLDRSFQTLDKLVNTDIQSIQSERVKQLEERCSLCYAVAELNETLRSHSFQISELFDIHNSCADPPILDDGYPLLNNATSHSGRKNGATVTYACRGNMTLVGSREIVCRSGEWTGDLPVCMNSCNTEDLKGYDGLDIPMNMITEHSESLSILCLEEYALYSPSEFLTCLNGTWNVSNNPCIKGCNTEDLKGYDGLDIPMNNITEHSKSLSIRCLGEYTLSSPTEFLTCLNGTWNVSSNPCIKGTCEGEPPTVLNGKTVAFERKTGSKVLYECNRNYFPNRISTVRCEKRNWVGEPPVCSFFDATFSLWTWTNWDWYYCHSKDNFQKMTFSRELDTGLGRHLPGGLTKTVGTDYVLFRFGMNTGLRGGPFGAFQCGYSDGRGSMNVVMARQDVPSGLYFSDPYKVAIIGDTVHLKVIFNKGYAIRWRHNGVEVPSWNNKEVVEIRNVQPTNAGTYECYYAGRRGSDTPALMRLTVRKCKMNLFGEKCDQQCPPCYNGGICHDHIGVCICPPGFIGKNCETACGRSQHGPDCSRTCHYTDCPTELFCLPDPYGCSCGPGMKGLQCNERCEKGWYGSNCKQPCHCAGGPQYCDIFTGACSGGCSTGWTGPSCQIQG